VPSLAPLSYGQRQQDAGLARAALSQRAAFIHLLYVADDALGGWKVEPITARTEDFERHRSLLFSIAYRMLGSVADAEDVVLEAYQRWQRAPEEVRSPTRASRTPSPWSCVSALCWKK
jgi:hypothetical protein